MTDRTVLTIAGSDASGGAGIAADLRALAAHGVHGAVVVTAVTAQGQGAHRVDPVPPNGVRAQLEAVFGNQPVHAVKIGMLGTADHARCVAEFFEAMEALPPIVLDPVVRASSGGQLLADDGVRTVATRLLPLVTLVTPNRDEAIALAGPEPDVGRWAATAPCAVLITGGDAPTPEVIDELYRTGTLERRWSAPRIGTGTVRGTGCTLSSAIAARLALGDTLPDAIDAGIGHVRDYIAVRARR